jgi:hypothetical protein
LLYYPTGFLITWICRCTGGIPYWFYPHPFVEKTYETFIDFGGAFGAEIFCLTKRKIPDILTSSKGIESEINEKHI